MTSTVSLETMEMMDATVVRPTAQVVTVTEQLDPNLDLSSFALGSMGFGSHIVAVPAGLSSYSTSVAVSATLRVDITATLNRTTGRVTWTFTSIDPTTGDLVSGALEGFLPPNDAAGDGAGFVTYTVRPKTGVITGRLRIPTWPPTCLARSASEMLQPPTAARSSVSPPIHTALSRSRSQRQSPCDIPVVSSEQRCPPSAATRGSRCSN